MIVILLSQYPPINQRLIWYREVTLAYVRGVIYPAGPVPTPLPQPTVAQAGTPAVAPSKTPIPTSAQLPPEATPTSMPSPTPLPGSVMLASPAWEKQDINNCGPAALAMYLRYFGWEGDQFDISNLVKPVREDRNVNVEELIYYVRTQAGWLNAEYRVGGDIQLLKRILAAGIPVMIEESFYFEDPFWPNDDLWAAHYQLLTGYDDAQQTFTAQDSFHGANHKVPFSTLDDYWKIFNRVYILVFLPGQVETVKSILGPDWDVDTNRRHALETAQAEAEADPEDAFAWFNVGSNQVYFENYNEAALAYDQARNLSLPQRMLRYQFGPFLAYFHAGRNQDLLALTEYALQRTPNAEEALLWHGWALYRDGDSTAAVEEFRAALEANPNYLDAQYALDFMGASP